MALAGACNSGGSLSEWTMARIRFRPASVSQNARTASWTAEFGRVALWSSATLRFSLATSRWEASSWLPKSAFAACRSSMRFTMAAKGR